MTEFKDFQALVCSEKTMGWGGVKRLGIDKISKRKGHQNFATVVGDIEAGKLIEVIDSHQQAGIIKTLEQHLLEVREKIEEVSVDMWGGFPKEETSVLAKMLNRSKRLKKAYEWKEEFRAYEQLLTVEAGKRQFKEWLRKARGVYSEVIGTIHNHLDGISNYFRNRTTSGAMEEINNRIKLIKRQAYGFVNFNTFCERLLACFSN